MLIKNEIERVGIMENIRKRITYRREGDYLIPDLTIGEQKQVRLGKYGMMRLNYLKMHNSKQRNITFLCFFMQ